MTVKVLEWYMNSAYAGRWPTDGFAAQLYPREIAQDLSLPKQFLLTSVHMRYRWTTASSHITVLAENLAFNGLLRD